MKKRTIPDGLRLASDWKRVRSMTDRQIRRDVEGDADAQPTDAKFWKTARVVLPQHAR
jgi:hypothetical protein